MHTAARGCRRFGSFEVDLDAGELRKRGRAIRLQEKPLRILAALLERPGEMLSRQELQDRLWADQTFVDFDHGLNNAVNKLRTALGDSAGAPRYIETVGRRGYRFIGSLLEEAAPHSEARPELLLGVSEADGGVSEHAAVVDHLPLPGSAASHSEHVPPTDSDEPRGVAGPTHRRMFSAGTVAGAAALLALVLLTITALKWGVWDWVKAGTAATPVGATSGVRGVAVLPLANLTGDHDQDFMASAVTDLLTTELAKLAPLKVISRTSAMSFEGPERPPAEEMARQLGVDTLIDGSVNRNGGRIHINLRMVNVPTDRHVWAQSFDGSVDDVVALHNQVAEAVRSQVARRMNDVIPGAASPVTMNSKSYELYLKGSFEVNQGGLPSLDVAIDYFKQALAIDGTVAPAYAGIAFARMRQDVFGDRRQYYYQAEVKDAVARALALDPNLADAHAAAGFARRFYDWDWAGAEAEFQRAISLNPSLAIAHTEYQFMLVGLGRVDDSLREARRATEVDPRAALSWVNEGQALFAARRYPEAERAYLQALQFKPDLRMARILLARLRLAQDRMAEAHELLRGLRRPPVTPLILALLAYGEAISGNGAEARRIINDPNVSFQKDLAMAAAVHAVLGDRQRAFEILQRGVEQHLIEPNMVLGPELDVLRRDPQFAQAISLMRLPTSAVDALIALPWASSHARGSQTVDHTTESRRVRPRSGSDSEGRTAR